MHDDPSDVEQKYEKINSDLILLLTNYNNYIYEIKMNICYDKKIFKNHLNNYIYILVFIQIKYILIDYIYYLSIKNQI